MKRIKRLNSYAAHARFLAECGDTLGVIERSREFPTPYSSGPTHCVIEWNGLAVTILETAHRRYDVFQVTQHPVFKNEEAFFQAAHFDHASNRWTVAA